MLGYQFNEHTSNSSAPLAVVANSNLVASVVFGTTFAARAAVVQLAVRMFGILILRPAPGVYPVVLPLKSRPRRSTPAVLIQHTEPRISSGPMLPAAAASVPTQGHHA